MVAKELLSSSKEQSDRAQLFPRERKKKKGSEKDDVPDEQKKKCFVRTQLKKIGKYKRKTKTTKKRSC